MAKSPSTELISIRDTDLKALQNYSIGTDSAAAEALYDALKAAGETQADAARAANPDSTEKLVTYNVLFTGTATKAAIYAALNGYTNALAVAANVVAATATSAVTDLATVSAAGTFELTLDGDPTGETSDLTIAAGELAYTTEAELTTSQLIYVDVNIDGTILEAAAETIVTDYLATVTAGAIVDHSALSALILADGSVTAVNSLKIDATSTPVPEVDFATSAGNLVHATAASITFTDAD